MHIQLIGSYHVFIRNPEPSKRPKFASVLQFLQHPDHKLLTWTPEDVAEQARTLGTPLEAGGELYKEQVNNDE